MGTTTLTRPTTVLTGHFYGGGRTLLSAVSVDGLWAFERAEVTGTPWEVALIPTGQLVPIAFGTLRDARAFTGSPDALGIVRRATADVAERGRTPEHRAEAVTLLRVLDGLITGALVTAEATHRCGECRGLLTETREGWRHVAACRPGCWTPGAELSPRHPCMTPERHTYCDDPWPAQCAHDCTTPADAAGTCDRAEEGRCCGCCRPDERGRP